MNLLQDIRAVAGTFGAIRAARRAGASSVKITAQPVHTIPVIKTGYWGQTMEGCLFYSRQWQAVRDVFGSFDEDTQRALTFTPEDGEWPDRVRFWQRQLKPALPSEMYHAAMLKIIRWYARCVRRRKEGGTNDQSPVDYVY